MLIQRENKALIFKQTLRCIKKMDGSNYDLKATSRKNFITDISLD